MGFLTLGRRFLNNQPRHHRRPHRRRHARPDGPDRRLRPLPRPQVRPDPAADYYSLYGVFASAPKNRAKMPRRCWSTIRQPVRSSRLPPRRSRQPRPQSRSAVPHDPVSRSKAGRHSNTAAAAAKWPRPSPAATIRSRPEFGSTASGGIYSAAVSSTRRATSAFAATPPTHPELLDSLACELMDDGWSTKRLIRRLVLSGTYRQSSAVTRRVRRRRSGKQTVLARQSPATRFGITPRLADCGRRSSRRENGRPIRLAHRRTILNAPLGLRFHRTPKPAGVFPHVRFRQSKHAHTRAATNHRPATGAVSHEQPLRHRAGPRAGRTHEGGGRRLRARLAGSSSCTGSHGSRAHAGGTEGGVGTSSPRRARLTARDGTSSRRCC